MARPRFEMHRWVYEILNRVETQRSGLTGHIEQTLHAEDVPAMTVADSLGNMATLDRWRAAIGLVYEQEKVGNPPAQTTVPSGDQ